MTNLFMLAGYSQYQAQCIAPFGYVIAAGILAQAVAPVVDQYIYRAAGTKSSSAKRKGQKPQQRKPASKLTVVRSWTS